MATQDQNEEGKRRNHYTEVSENDALGRGNDTHGTMGQTSGNNAGAAEGLQNVGACELDVFFDTDSSTLGKASQERLDRVAECMKRKEVDHATIVGQTDPTGTKEHNDKLSLERARVVAEYLRSRGVPENQIRVRGKGAVASAENPDLWPSQRKSDIQTTQ